MKELEALTLTGADEIAMKIAQTKISTFTALKEKADKSLKSKTRELELFRGRMEMVGPVAPEKKENEPEEEKSKGVSDTKPDVNINEMMEQLVASSSGLSSGRQETKRPFDLEVMIAMIESGDRYSVNHKLKALTLLSELIELRYYDKRRKKFMDEKVLRFITLLGDKKIAVNDDRTSGFLALGVDNATRSEDAYGDNDWNVLAERANAIIDRLAVRKDSQKILRELQQLTNRTLRMLQEQIAEGSE